MTPERWDVTAEEYHASPYIGSSMLAAFRQSPALYHGLYVSKTIQNTTTPEKNLGSAFHECLRDPAGYRQKLWKRPSTYLDGSKINRRLKAHREYEACLMLAAEAKGQIILKAKDEVEPMALAVRSNPAVAMWLEDGLVEYPICWQDATGLWCKAMADLWHPEHRVILDYKTCADPSPEGFRRQVRKYGLHCQAAHYISGFGGDDGSAIKHYFVAVRSKPPYDCLVYEIGSGTMHEAHWQNIYDLRNISSRTAQNHWEPLEWGEVVELEL